MTKTDAPKPKQTFQVEVEMLLKGTPRKWSRTMDTDTLDQIIGRYCRRYGPPMDVTKDQGITWFQWYDIVSSQRIEIDLFFKENTGILGEPVVETKKEVPVITREVNPIIVRNQDPNLTSGQLESLLKASVLTKVS